MRSASPSHPIPKPIKNRTGQDSPIDRITATLAPICEELDVSELQLLIDSYSHVSCELEIHRFAQTWSSGPLRSLRPLERWLSNARPSPEVPVGIGSSKSLDPLEVERRVEHFRRNIVGCEVFGEPFLEPEEVRFLCAEYREKLETRR